MPPGPVKKLLFKINYVLLNFTDPGALINIDGLNDFGIIVNNTVNTLISIVRNRLVSIVNEQLLTPKINEIFDAISFLLPEDIHLGGDLYLEGLLYDNPTYNDTYMVMGVDTTIVNISSPYPGNNTFDLTLTQPFEDYQATMQVT